MKRTTPLLMAVLCGALVAPCSAIDEEQWLLEVSALEPDERRARLQKDLKHYAREHCGLFLGALLSDDEEIILLIPAIQRQARALVQPEDVAFLSEKLESLEDPLRKDWVIDLLGFCGKPGFQRLRALHADGDSPRVRLGALRAMANTGLPEALAYVSAAVPKATGLAEKEAALFAQTQLRWRTGQMKPDQVGRAPRPRVDVESGGQRIRAALARGGTFTVGAAGLSDGIRGLLKELEVQVPTDFAKRAPQHCVFSTADFHRLLAYPFDFFCADVAAGTFADSSWGKWHEGQVAPLRLQESPERAAVVIQEGVSGKGRVVFSGISMHSVSSAARLGIADRDPWDENVSWFHADRDIAGHLFLWQAQGKFVSQHVPWGKPLKGGPIRAAIVTPAYNARDAAEFAQRLALEYEHLPFDWAQQKGFAHGIELGRLTPPCFEMLERTLAAPRDVVVLAGRSKPGKSGPQTWSVLPAAYQETLLRACRDQGIGLVIVGESGPFSKLPEEATKNSLARPFASISRAEWGKGRIAVMGRARGAPAGFGTSGAFHSVVRLNPYDYWAADVVAEIAWAAGRGAPVEILGKPEVQGDSIRLQACNRGDASVEGTLHVEFRNRSGRIAAKGKVDIGLDAGQEAEVAVPVKDLSAGFFMAEISVRDKEGASLGWNWATIQIRGASAIKNLKFDRPVYRPGEEMTVEIVTDGELPDGVQAEAKILDRYGRLCGQSRGEVAPAAPSCRVTVGRPLWRYVYVVVSLRKDGKLLSQFERPWIVEVPARTSDFPYFAWSDISRQASLAPMVHLAEINCLNTDFERCLHNGIQPWILNFGGLGLGHHAPSMGYQRYPCTMGPTFHQWRLNAIPPRIPGALRAGVLAFIDQDEENLGGEYGFHPASLHEFRKHLKVEHGSLERLNEVWDSDYKKWDEVMPMLRKQVAGRKSLAPMVELRMFMDTAYLHHVKFDRFVAESSGAQDVKLGLSTSGGGFADGWDIWKASQMLTCMIRQHTGNRELFRCWARPDMVLGRWSGGYYPDNVTSGHFMPWHQLFHGSTVYATWGSGMGNYMSIWRADAGPRDGIAAAAEELRQIRSGPAALIRHSKRVPPQFGVLYSRASQMASAAEWWSGTWGAAGFVEGQLELMGHQYRWISYEELEQGFCDRWPGKLLYLPLSICLSKHEVAAARRFVERGGVVVVDCDAGTRDQHGGPAGPGQLAEVFGCEWAPAPPAAKGQRAKATLKVDGLPEEISLSHQYRRIAKLTTGKANGTVSYGGQEFPAWITHPFGKGQALTLNFLPARSNAASAVMRALLRAAKVTHEAGVAKDGEEMRAVERFSYQDGENRYSGVLHFVKIRRHWGELRLEPGEEKPTPGVELRFPVKAHLYDVRAKKYLGMTDRTVMDLEPARAYLFAHLPYRAESVDVQPVTASVRGPGRVAARVIAGDRTPSGHALRVQLFEPAGKERPEYGTVEHFPEGKGEVEVPFAPSDPTGKWRVVVTDAATGVSAEEVWEVRQ